MKIPKKYYAKNWKHVLISFHHPNGVWSIYTPQDEHLISCRSKDECKTLLKHLNR